MTGAHGRPTETARTRASALTTQRTRKPKNCHGGTATCTEKAICKVLQRQPMASWRRTTSRQKPPRQQYLKSAATCTEKAVYYKSCAVCGLTSKGTDGRSNLQSRQSRSDHDWGAWTSNGDGTHTRTCTVDGCSAGTQTENCIDANKDHKCDICDYIISECADDNKDHKCDYCGKKLTEHTGGKATCKDKAKCEVCGAEATESLNAKNHTDLKALPGNGGDQDCRGQYRILVLLRLQEVLQATATATQEIKQADTVTAKLPGGTVKPGADKSPQTGDNSNLLLWIALLFISGGAAIGTTVVSRKKKYNR